MDLLLTKYTRALVSYKGLSRIETYEYPEKALREALLNAVSHKDYAGCIPFKFAFIPIELKFGMRGQLPDNWTIQKLFQEHSSRPYNPDIANAFFRNGYVESWGRGIEKMSEMCTAAGLPMPQISNKGTDFG